jgi:hypothetical protein
MKNRKTKQKGEDKHRFGNKLTNLFPKLFILVSISFTRASDGTLRAFCTSTRKGLPEPNIRTWEQKLHRLEQYLLNSSAQLQEQILGTSISSLPAA